MLSLPVVEATNVCHGTWPWLNSYQVLLTTVIFQYIDRVHNNSGLRSTPIVIPVDVHFRFRLPLWTLRVKKSSFWLMRLTTCLQIYVKLHVVLAWFSWGKAKHCRHVVVVTWPTVYGAPRRIPPRMQCHSATSAQNFGVKVKASSRLDFSKGFRVRKHAYEFYAWQTAALTLLEKDPGSTITVAVLVQINKKYIYLVFILFRLKSSKKPFVGHHFRVCLMFKQSWFQYFLLVLILSKCWVKEELNLSGMLPSWRDV